MGFVGLSSPDQALRCWTADPWRTRGLRSAPGWASAERPRSSWSDREMFKRCLSQLFRMLFALFGWGSFWCFGLLFLFFSLHIFPLNFVWLDAITIVFLGRFEILGKMEGFLCCVAGVWSFSTLALFGVDQLPSLASFFRLPRNVNSST